MLKNILVALDGSDNSERALAFAIELARRFDARLTILSVYKHYSNLETTYSLVKSREAPEAPDKTLSRLAKEFVAKAADQARQQGLEQVDTKVHRGPPARTIIEQAKKLGVDAIILGSRGLGDVTGLLLGSVSHKVTSLAECTCITVK